MTRAAIVLTVLLLFVPLCRADAQMPSLESRLNDFIRQMYQEEDGVRVKYLNLPDKKDRITVRNINLARVPDANGEGIALIETAENGRLKNIYVTFRVLLKKKLFVTRNGMKKGDVLRRSDLLIREAYLTGAQGLYPAGMGDVEGRVLRKDIQAGTTITAQLIEERHSVQKGEIVEIVVQSSRLVVHAKGRAVDKGKIGDMVRVKNLESGKEVLGKVAAGDKVVVEF